MVRIVHHLERVLLLVAFHSRSSHGLAVALPITSLVVGGAFLLGAVILLFIGPVSSKKTKVRGEAHRTLLFKKLYSRLIVLGVLLVIFPTSISVFFVAGALKAVVLVVIAKLGGYH
nr:hypothetical protein [Lysinibacillus xylanilyticus]